MSTGTEKIQAEGKDADEGIHAVRRAAASPSEHETSHDNWTVERRLEALDRAYHQQVVYITGKEQLRLLAERNGLFKRVVLGTYIWLRENTRAKIAQWKLPVEKLVEVGFVREI